MTDIVMTICAGGGGDLDIKFFEPEIWEWFKNPDENMPQIAAERITGERISQWADPELTVEEETERIIRVVNDEQSGSAFNDTVLSTVIIARAWFNNMTSAIRYIRNNDLNVIEEWQGMIY